jgi:FADH2 O2-dependent halogenase
VNQTYDVVILGSGIGGSMLACILAKRGIRTLLVEELVHPRFTIGESLIPETGLRLRVLAEKHGVPEIGWLGNFYALRDNVSSACGVKRSFAFMYHRPGERARADQVNQLPTLTPPFGPDSHLFRQDTDAWLAAIAMKYGAHLRQQTKVSAVHLGEEGVRIEVANGPEIRGRFLIDAGGMRSHVSTQLGLRDATPRFRTDTRTLYTHFMDLKAADFLLDGADPGVPSPLGQGTMHHVFDGGWMWMIPFNNHREATNPLASVGLMLDRRKFGDPKAPAEEEFRQIISRFPSIQRHFSEARAVRPWLQSGRIQYSQTQMIGRRWLQLPHAASFVDPLYSSGMSVLTVSIDLIADQLLGAFQDGDFDTARFQHIQDIVNAGFDHYDLIVSRSFDAFADYDLWNAWNRNWMLGNFLGTGGPLALLIRSLSSGDMSHLLRTSDRGRIGVLSSHLPQVREVMLANAALVDDATAGRLTPAEASRQIFARLAALDFVPARLGFGDPNQRAPTDFTLPGGLSTILWYGNKAPPAWQEYMKFSPFAYAWLALKFVATQVGGDLRRAYATVRDVFSPWNQEWRYNPRGLSGHGLRTLPPPYASPPAAAEVSEVTV